MRPSGIDPHVRPLGMATESTYDALSPSGAWLSVQSGERFLTDGASRLEQQSMDLQDVVPEAHEHSKTVVAGGNELGHVSRAHAGHFS
jgi:hypothetical protein